MASKLLGWQEVVLFISGNLVMLWVILGIVWKVVDKRTVELFYQGGFKIDYKVKK